MGSPKSNDKWDLLSSESKIDITDERCPQRYYTGDFTNSPNSLLWVSFTELCMLHEPKRFKFLVVYFHYDLEGCDDNEVLWDSRWLSKEQVNQRVDEFENRLNLPYARRFFEGDQLEEWDQALQKRSGNG